MHCRVAESFCFSNKALMSSGSAKPLPKSPRALKKLAAPVAGITLCAGVPVDRLSIAAWVAHLRSVNREDLAAAAEAAQSFVVRKRWPKDDTPLPRIPIDFRARVVPDR